jgi:class 3 adenylate cyclase
MTTKTMVQLAGELLPRYDLHERLGLRESVAVPTANAAGQIVDDMCRARVFPQFVQLLARAQHKGFRGRTIRIAHLSRLIRELTLQGFIFDAENDMFIEDGRTRKSLNWSVLLEGKEYNLTFLRFDVSGNSLLVRNNPAKKVDKAYRDIFGFLNSSLEKRNGRLWTFQGDGGLAAFAFSDKDLAAVLCAVDFLHELFLYNACRCPLSSPVSMRLAVHSGPHVFSFNTDSLKKADTVKEIMDIESKHTKPNSVTVSNKVFNCLDRRLADLFVAVKRAYMHTLYTYEFRME